jgi:hypothetical protein
MARGSSSSKKVERGSIREPNPEVTERKRLKRLAFANSVLSETPAKANAPGLFAPLGGGKIGELKDLGSKNPVLYLDFPQVPCFFHFLCLLPNKF